jgi:predicted DsbA family dithiol-disulfide isomerase
MVTAAEGVTCIASIVAPVRVKIFQDLVCPWCYIGKSRFDVALSTARQQNPDLEVEITFGPYQLDPSAPVDEARPVIEAYAAKFGGPERAAAILERVTEAAREAGLEMNMDIAKRANTRLAHRLLLAADASTASLLLDALYRAYFVEGRSIADHSTLREIAAQVELESSVVDGVLEGDLMNDRFDSDLRTAHDQGVTAVPTFVFDERWAVPGAQDPEFFLRVFDKLADA